MKGFFFQYPLEYHLNVAGEEWEQGTTLNGTFRVRNSENKATSCKLLQLLLVYGVFKKIKAKEPQAWTELQSRVLAENIDFDPGRKKRSAGCSNWRLTIKLRTKAGVCFFYMVEKVFILKGESTLS